MRFSHFGIFARRPNALGKFYERVLGFTETDRGALPSGDLIFLSRDPAEHHQIVLCSGRPADGNTTVNQISLQTDELDDLRAVFRLLQRESEVSAVASVSSFLRRLPCLWLTV